MEINLEEILKTTDPKKLDEVLSTVLKYEKILDKVIILVDKLGKYGVLQGVSNTLQKAGGSSAQQSGAVQHIQQQPQPQQQQQHPLSIIASTSTHHVLFKQLNELSEDDLTSMSFEPTKKQE